MDGPRFEFHQRQTICLFSKASGRASWPTISPTQWVPCFFLVGKSY